MRVHMPEENPRRKRRTPPRGAGGRFRKRKTATRRKRRRNPALATVGLNPKRRRAPARTRTPARTRARTVTRYRYRNRPKRRYARRRRNPRLPFGLGRVMGVSLPSLSKVGFGLFGVIGTQTLPTLVPWTAARNQGFFGYLFELGSLVATATVAGMIGGSSAKGAAAIGGGIRIAYRAAYDFGVLGMIPGGAPAEVPPANVAGYIDPPPTSQGGGGMGAFYGEQYGMVPQPASY